MKVDMKTFEIVRLHMGDDGLEFIETVCGPFKTLAKAQKQFAKIIKHTSITGGNWYDLSIRGPVHFTKGLHSSYRTEFYRTGQEKSEVICH
tara:strand:+ start:517 stop:789 length:273 start_codon:yes stop_codon:yes gene_type:complete